jgi:hypothetical protein
MRYTEETIQIAEEGRQFANPIVMPYICARRKVVAPPKKRLYGERASALIGGLIATGIAVLSILGFLILVGPN